MRTLSVIGVAVACLLLVLVHEAEGKVYFGYYEAYLNETAPYSTIYQANSIEAAQTAHAQGLPSLLLVEDQFLQSIPNRTILLPDWPTRWAAMAQRAAPLLRDGTLLGFNLGDELVWNCLAPSNLTIVADAVRASFPRGSAVVWYNEATPPIASKIDSCGHKVPDYAVPSSLDWFSTDIYHYEGEVDGWVNSFVRTFYEKQIYPILPAGVKVVLVPGAFGSDVNHYPNGTYICNRSCYDVMCAHDAEDFVVWAKADPRVVGVFPWNWGGCPECNGSRWTPPHTCCMDELGARVQPLTSATWQRLAKDLAAVP